jgi:hypothetical protein
MQHRSKRITLALAGVVAVGTAVAVPLGSAVAGHTNTLLESTLDGRAEVGDGNRIAGDPNGTGEVYVFGIDGDPTTLCYVLTVDRIERASAAHIHEAGAGENGDVVVNLAAPGDGNAADCLTEGEILPSGAPAFVGDTTAAEILANPEEYYVNVHNSEYPGGALRGQLSPQG